MNEDILFNIFKCMCLFVTASLAASLFVICIIDIVKDNPNTISRRIERSMKNIFLTRRK